MYHLHPHLLSICGQFDPAVEIGPKKRISLHSLQGLGGGQVLAGDKGQPAHDGSAHHRGAGAHQQGVGGDTYPAARAPRQRPSKRLKILEKSPVRLVILNP